MPNSSVSTSGAGLEDVGGEHDAGGQRADEQQPGRRVGGQRGACARAAPARRRSRAPRPARRAAARSPRRSASTSAGEAGGADGVREEREPAQHDPASEQAGRHREQQHLEQRALDVRAPRGRASGLGPAGDRAAGEARRRSPRCWPRSSRRRCAPSEPAGPSVSAHSGRPTRAPVSRAIASSTSGLTELSAKIAFTRSRRIVSTSAAVSPADGCARSRATGSRRRRRARP